MNDKLKKWNLSQVRPPFARGSGNRIDALVAIKANTGAKEPKLTVSFHERAIKKLGWIAGDKVTIEYDNGDVILHRSDDGLVLSLHKASGKRGYLRYRMLPEYLSLFVDKIASNIEIENGAIAFTLINS